MNFDRIIMMLKIFRKTIIPSMVLYLMPIFNIGGDSSIIEGSLLY